MDPDELPELSALETQVMEAVWATEPATVRALVAHLQPERAYTTVMTVCVRLTEKGMVTRRREGKTDVYAAAVSRVAYGTWRARTQTEVLVEELGDLALVQFAARLDALDLEHRRLLERLVRDGRA